MKQERKIYDPVFKTKAVQLRHESTNILELKVSLLYKWRKEQVEFCSGSFLGNGKLKLTIEQEKINELEKKLKDAALERDILKKAISIF